MQVTNSAETHDVLFNLAAPEDGSEDVSAIHTRWRSVGYVKETTIFRPDMVRFELVATRRMFDQEAAARATHTVVRTMISGQRLLKTGKPGLKRDMISFDDMDSAPDWLTALMVLHGFTWLNKRPAE